MNVLLILALAVTAPAAVAFLVLWLGERRERRFWFRMWHSRNEFLTSLIDERRRLHKALAERRRKW